MTDRHYGYRYGELGEHPSTTEISKAIRQDIKQAVKEGLLPGSPVQFSVRTEYFSGGSSIDITVRNWDSAWQECDGTVPGTRKEWPDGGSTATACPNLWCAARNDPERAAHATPHLVLTEHGQAAKMTLDRIINAYNHDGSDVMTDYFDVRFYGHVTFESPDGAAFRAKEKARLAERRAAIDEAAKAEKVRVVVHGRERQVVHDAVEVDGKVRLVCGATLWRSSWVSKTTKDLTCSRCAKRAAQ